jgi:NitT/TauT family transport system substrate-binding protein
MKTVRLLVVLTIVAAMGGSAWAQSNREKLTVGWSSFDATHLPIFVTKEAGLFEREGLDVELVYLESGTAATQALVAGQADVVSAGGSAVMNARLGGAPVKIIGSISNRLFQEIWVPRDVTQPEQLKGKKWGISAFGSEAHLAALLALEHWAMKPDRDVVLIPVGGGVLGRLAALSKGTISATTLIPPATKPAAESGLLRRLGNTADLTGDYMSLPIAAQEETLQKRRRALERFLIALSQGVERTRKDRDLGVAVLAKYLNLKGKMADAEAAYDFYREVAPVSLRPSLEGIQFVLAHLENPRAKTTPAADFVSLEILNDLAQRGLVPR